MTALLMMKEKIKSLYASYHGIIVPTVKAIIAFIMLMAINDKIGYMRQLDSFLVVLVLAAVCAFTPRVITVLVGLIVILGHLYSLSMELALVAAAVFAVMLFLYLRFCSKELLLLVLVPVSFYIGIPYVMPLLVGVLCGPTAVLTFCCGIIVHYYIDYVSVNALTIQGMTTTGSMDKIRVALDGIIHNEEMFLALLSFAAATIVVHILRRQSVDHAWSMAIFTGAMTNVILNFMGLLIFDNGPSIIGLLLGTVIAIPVAMFVGFLFMGLDYSRTERVQFEDEDYYYYVKVVPKMNIKAPSKTVKKINTQRNRTYYK
ncbi:MAG: hypothetical protein IKK03_11405 [Lachnospiraceae bacterium]|nr:hypothetical protein [Lachnospiraceae bacterium]MBR4060433.1 hypothetical protein [Lachnospiraceae bacterium]